MSALFCVILLCFFWGCRMDLKAVTGDGLARENARAFRGILSVLVVCYHLSQRTGDRSLFHLFVFFGFLPVSYFFFLSGYGLQKSFAKKPHYRASILKKRIPSVALPYLFFICLYWLLSCWEGTPSTPKEVLLSLINGNQERELLERKETDAQRQHNALEDKISTRHQIDVLNKKVVVLEITDQRHIEQNAQNQERLGAMIPLLLDRKGDHIVYRNGCQDQRQIFDVLVTVEKQ